MKIATVYLLDYAMTEGRSRTAQLTADVHEPEQLPNGWIRFKCDGDWHQIPPTLVRRITEVNPVTAIVRETEKLGGYEAELRNESKVSKSLTVETEKLPEPTADMPKRRGRPPNR